MTTVNSDAIINKFIIRAIEENDIETLEELFTWKKINQIKINDDCFVKALLTFNKSIIVTIFFTGIKTYDLINIIKTQIDELHLMNVLKIVFPIDIIVSATIFRWLIESRNASFFLDNSEFWKIQIDAIRLYYDTVTPIKSFSMAINTKKIIENLLYNADFSNFLKDEQMLELLIDYKTINKEQGGILYFLYTHDNNVKSYYILGSIFRIIKKRCGEKIYIKLFKRKLMKYIKIYTSLEIYKIYYFLTIVNISMHYDDCIINKEILNDTGLSHKIIEKKKMKKIEFDEKINMILYDILNIKQYIKIMPYIMILVKKLNIQLTDRTKLSFVSSKTNRKCIIFYSMMTEYHNDIFYFNLNKEDTEYFDKLNKDQIIALSEIFDFLPSALIPIISGYKGYYDKKYEY